MNQLKSSFPLLKDSQLLNDLDQASTLIDLEVGQVILKPDQFINAIPLILEGAIKVQKEDVSGSFIFLYFILPGETCTMTLSSCLNRQKSTIKAEAIQPTKVILLPSQKMIQFMRIYPNWNQFLLNAYKNRFDSLLGVIENSSLHSKEEQLLVYINSMTSIYNSNIIRISHKQIASDLGTHRVVVSRILKKLESDGILRLGRGQITLTKEKD